MLLPCNIMEEEMEEEIGKEQTEYDNEKDDRTSESSIDIFDMEDIMESMVKISFCGLGGTVIGLSLEKRLESMKLTTAEGIAAAARRKRGGMRTAHQSNLVTAWALSCIAFSSIIEISRLTSPSTWILNQVEAMNGTTLYSIIGGDFKTTKSPVITVADHSIGGAIAGVTCSFGRRMYSKNLTVIKLGRSRTISGFLSGLALGVAAGTAQAAIDYGTTILQASNHSE